ncbi:MAG: hypothetical protein NTY79_01555 [Chloroflexi bacterium]|nr:hypothetical protein [Chloroflexota bacterium]
MPHWDSRKETNWSKFHFNQPYAKGLKRLKEDVLGKTDFDPAVLFQWGTMQAMAVIRILKDCEQEFGEKGQQVVSNSLRRIGYDMVKQTYDGLGKPEGIPEAEIVSFFATVVNTIFYASLEEPRIEGDERISFDITWCPHQDHYSAFDCRVQRYMVQGMLDALFDMGWISRDWQVKFTCTIPAGAKVCNFVFWKASGEEKTAWELYTGKLEQRALRKQ